MNKKTGYFLTAFMLLMVSFNLCGAEPEVSANQEKLETFLFRHLATKVTMPDKVVVPAERGYFNEFYTLLIKINDKGPYRFILDTGAELNYISLSLANELGLDVIETKTMKISTSNQQVATVTETMYGAEKVQMNEAIFNELKFFAGTSFEDEATMLEKVGVHGIIGLNPFYKMLLTLDLSKEKIILSKGNLLHDERAGPMRMRRFSPRVIATLIAQTSVPYEFIVDTGFFGKFRINYCEKNDMTHMSEPPLELKSYDLYDTTQTSYYSTFNGKIKINDIVIKNPEVVYSLNTCPHEKEFLREGLLGVALMRQYQVTLDPQNQKILFVPNP